MRNELKTVLVNMVLAIVFAEISAMHTILVIGQERFVEANPITLFTLNLNQVTALLIPILVIVGLDCASLKIHDHAGMCISSILVGFTAFDLWTHIYLML